MTDEIKAEVAVEETAEIDTTEAEEALGFETTTTEPSTRRRQFVDALADDQDDQNEEGLFACFHSSKINHSKN
jgi:hypothetical protein